MTDDLIRFTDLSFRHLQALYDLVPVLDEMAVGGMIRWIENDTLVPCSAVEATIAYHMRLGVLP